MKSTSDLIIDPDLYERMSVGHASLTEARKALKDFSDEVQVLREKYVIRDLVLLAGAIATIEGERLYLTNGGYRGTPVSALLLVANIADKLAANCEKDGE